MSEQRPTEKHVAFEETDLSRDLAFESGKEGHVEKAVAADNEEAKKREVVPGNTSQEDSVEEEEPADSMKRFIEVSNASYFWDKKSMFFSSPKTTEFVQGVID